MPATDGRAASAAGSQWWATAELAGQFGPVAVEAEGTDTLRLHAQAFGLPEPVLCDRLGGNTFDVRSDPPGSTPLSLDEDLLRRAVRPRPDHLVPPQPGCQAPGVSTRCRNATCRATEVAKMSPT